MPFINPYKEVVEKNPLIIDSAEDAYEKKWKWKEFFKNQEDIVLEIGTGMGNNFSREIALHPQKNFIGMEIKYKRLQKTAEKSLSVWGKHFLIIKDFGQNIKKIFASNELSQTIIFFPDPWGKKDRQKKHRLITKEFLNDLFDITKSWGKLLFKTDHREYFEEIIKILEELKIWKVNKCSYDYENDLEEEFCIKKITEFEAFYRKDKTKICFLELEK